jgi:hypothetical protein
MKAKDLLIKRIGGLLIKDQPIYACEIPLLKKILVDLLEEYSNIQNQHLKDKIEEAYTDGFNDATFDFDLENYISPDECIIHNFDMNGKCLICGYKRKYCANSSICVDYSDNKCNPEECEHFKKTF